MNARGSVAGRVFMMLIHRVRFLKECKKMKRNRTLGDCRVLVSGGVLENFMSVSHSPTMNSWATLSLRNGQVVVSVEPPLADLTYLKQDLSWIVRSLEDGSKLISFASVGGFCCGYWVSQILVDSNKARFVRPNERFLGHTSSP